MTLHTPDGTKRRSPQQLVVAIRREIHSQDGPRDRPRLREIGGADAGIPVTDTARRAGSLYFQRRTLRPDIPATATPARVTAQGPPLNESLAF